MKTTRILAAALALLLLSASLVSCAAKADMESGRDMAYDMMYAENSKAESTTSATSKPSSAGSAFGATADAVEMPNTSEFAAKIIKTVNMNTETKEYDQAISELDRLITENGGFVESSSANGQSLDYNGVYRRSAKYTIRIPAQQLDTFLSASQQLLNVTYSHSTSENITAEYYDIQSRLEVLRTERDALNAMLEKATDIDSMLSIRDRLYNVIEEIESYETRLRVYDSLVSYSTVHMTVDEVVEYTKIQAEEPTWGERLVEAFKESWEDFAVGFQNFTVGFLYAIPTLLVLGVIAVAVILILRVIIRRQRAAYEARRAERENKK
jgi:hypothetical protein